MSTRRRSIVVLVCAAACAAAGLAPSVRAAPPITVTSKTPADGPIEYTVQVTSKTFGNLQETRTISSGQVDDFNWKAAPAGAAASVPQECPGYSALQLDASGALARQMSIRLAPIVAGDGTATVQMSVQASAPKGKTTVKVGGKTLQCPQMSTMSQVLRFTMPTNGTTKSVTLHDGTRVSIVAKR